MVRARLAPGGLVALNVATVPGDPRLQRALAGTLASVFPDARVWPVLRFNHLVIGLTRRPARIRVAAAPRLAALVARLRRDLSPRVAPAADPWTDDHAPVEWVTDRMILEYGLRGGELDEDRLPTAPR